MQKMVRALSSLALLLLIMILDHMRISKWQAQPLVAMAGWMKEEGVAASGARERVNRIPPRYLTR